MSKVVAKSPGLLNRLMLMNVGPGKAPLRNRIGDMADLRSQAPREDQREIAALFLPNDRFDAGSSASCSGDDLVSTEISASDFPAYTASPTDGQFPPSPNGQDHWRNVTLVRN